MIFYYLLGIVKGKIICFFFIILEKILRKIIIVFCVNDVVEEFVLKLLIKFRVCINVVSNI